MSVIPSLKFAKMAVLTFDLNTTGSASRDELPIRTSITRSEPMVPKSDGRDD